MKADPTMKSTLCCTLHQVATELANKDPRISNEDEKTLTMEYRRLLQSGLQKEILFNGFYYWYEYDRYATSKAVHKLFKQDQEYHDRPLSL